ncbi:MAG: hypothetical protein H7Y00_15830 [Fimbriimonadaceae bacterium]|nr:hypothetical protein [Chitinophagales bacterium]
MRFNMLKKIHLVAAVLFISCSFFYSCYYDNAEFLLSETICDTTAVSFSADIVPILQTYCYKCHSIEMADDQGEGYILETYALLMESTNGETLVDVVDWIDGGANNMPKSGSQLPACERALIRNWVAQGELDN